MWDIVPTGGSGSVYLPLPALDPTSLLALVWFSLGPVCLPEKVATFRDYKKLFVLFWGRRYTGSWVLLPIYEKLKDSEERRPLNPAFLQPKLNVCGTAFKGGG